jgi:hypothetical protein
MAKVTLEIDIDWAMLKKQKSDLLNVLGYDESLQLDDAVSKEQKESLEGILNLIDGIQAYAVDSGQFKENDVFNLSDN